MTTTTVQKKAEGSTPIVGEATYQRVLGELLDGPAGSTVVIHEVQVHRLIRHGLSVQVIKHLEDAGVGRQTIGCIVKPRTLDHRKAKGEPLSTEESDRAYRVAHLVALADSIFGDHDKAMRWLNKPKQRFEGETPFSMASTTQGTAMVEEMLYGIEHGFFA